MSITSALVLFFVIWFIVMFLTLQITMRSQADEGEVVPGTHEGAPSNFRFGRTMLIVTGITLVLWAVIAGIIISGVIEVRDFDWFGRMDNMPADPTQEN